MIIILLCIVFSLDACQGFRYVPCLRPSINSIKNPGDRFEYDVLMEHCRKIANQKETISSLYAPLTDFIETKESAITAYLVAKNSYAAEALLNDLRDRNFIIH